jgi:hypothetical protein
MVGAKPAIARCGFARVMLVVFVVLTAAISLVWSHNKMMSQDELYAFHTDSVRSVAELVEVQRVWPISLDPLLVHLLSHEGMRVFGVGAFALRLPALVGFLLMQICLFFFVRDLAGERAGLVAAVFPALTATLFYSAEGRPYGLMLGLYALALLCWQVAARRVSIPTFDAVKLAPNVGHPRTWPLIGLAVAIAATINAHYFGVLLLGPICAGELVRTVMRRRVDWAVVGAICVGMAGFVGTIPFLKAAGEFKKNYYNGGGISLHDITRAYRSIFVDYTQMSMAVQHVAMMVLMGFAVALVWGCVRVMRRRAVLVPVAEWVAIGTLAALPFCGYLLARFVTHSIEVRYVLGAVVAISAMVAVAMSEWMRRDEVFSAVVAVLLGALIGTGVVRVHDERRATTSTMAALVLPVEAKRALNSSADGTLYIQDMGWFLTASYYEPDADVRARLALVYSSDEELRWDRHDTMALTAMHMQHFTGFRIVPYEMVRGLPGERVFMLIHSGWNFTDEAFAEDGARVRPVGKAMRGDVVGVRFR